MLIVPATQDDVPQAVASLVEAFAGDPLMVYFFQGRASSRRHIMQEFFSILMLARLALRKPVMVLRDSGTVGGIVMGYDTERPDWPEELKHRMTVLEEGPGVAARFAKYTEIAVKFEPSSPHYYLGVLGVRPELQVKGAGTQLIRSFAGLSNRDPKSSGVFLETAEESNLEFYKRRGFEVRGSEPLDEHTTLWCLFLSTR
jgi:ribosomal protein S18 acetylase RimI-like enzyme